MGLIRALVTVVVLGGLVYCGATVELGSKTFFQHVAAIWQSNETQELVDGVKDKGGPLVEKVKRGVEAGVDEIERDRARDAGSPEEGAQP